jgi:hypothetical protein
MNSTQSDITKIIPANGEVNVAVRGEFVFIKAASSKLTIVVNQEPLEMQAGDLRRVINTFDNVEVKNQTGVDQPVELVIGFGEYNRLIVRGEISSFDSLIGVSGLARLDTRRALSLSVGLTAPDPVTYEQFETIEQVAAQYQPAGQVFSRFILNKKDELIGVIGNRSQRFDRFSGLPVSPVFTLVADLGNFAGVCQHPELGNLAFYNESAGDITSFVKIAENGQLSETPVAQIGYGAPGYETREVSFFRNGNALYKHSDSLEIRNGIEGPVIFQLNTSDNEDYELFLFNATFGVSTAQSIASPFENEIIIGYDRNNYVSKVNYITGEKTVIDDRGAVTNTYLYWDYLNNRLIDGSSTTFFREIALEAGSFWGKGIVAKTDRARLFKGIDAYKIKQTENPAFSYDALSTELTADIIRIAIEGYWRNAGRLTIPSDYLDYVHALKIDGVTMFDTGVSSFAREGIIDQFTIEQPSIVELTITAELEP